MEKTIQFSLNGDEKTNKELLVEIYQALELKGYDPVGQISGYLLTEDPTYITSAQNARQKIRKIDRDELLAEMIANYLFTNEN